MVVLGVVAVSYQRGTPVGGDVLGRESGAKVDKLRTEAHKHDFDLVCPQIILSTLFFS